MFILDVYNSRSVSARLFIVSNSLIPSINYCLITGKNIIQSKSSVTEQFCGKQKLPKIAGM